jgi:hypothetical protein
LCVIHWNRVSLFIPGCPELAVLLEWPQTHHLSIFTEDICKITPSVMTGFNPLCISIYGKDEPFFKSLSIKFSIHIIYHLCEGNQAKYKWQHMFKGQWLLPHSTPSTRTVKVIPVDIETIFATKSHDDGSTNSHFNSGLLHSHSPFTFKNHIVHLTPHWIYFLNWE